MKTAKELIAEFPQLIEEYKTNLFSEFYERMIKEFCKHGFNNFGQPYQSYWVSKMGEFWSNKEIAYIGQELVKLGYFVNYEYSQSDPTEIEAIEIKLQKYTKIE